MMSKSLYSVKSNKSCWENQKTEKSTFCNTVGSGATVQDNTSDCNSSIDESFLNGLKSFEKLKGKLKAKVEQVTLILTI